MGRWICLNLNIEISSSCNLNCLYCPRRNASGLERFMPLGVLERVVRAVEPERVVLIGLGEPTMHPRFREVLEVLRDSQVVLQTNGTFPERVRMAVEVHPDLEVALSLDLPPSVAGRFRIGLEPGKIEETMRIMSRRRSTISALMMRASMEALPELLSLAASYDIESLDLSGMVPITEELDKERVFTFLSRRLFEYLEGRSELVEIAYRAARIVLDSWGPVESNELRAYEAGVREMEALGLTPNFALYEMEARRAREALRWERYLRVLEEEASSLGIRLKRTSLFAQEARKCPYAETETGAVSATGELSPCYDLLHDHTYFIFGHEKRIKAVRFGPAWERASMDSYRAYREKLLEFDRNFAPCHTCPFAARGACFFVPDNEVDCEGASPTCSECPFALDLVSCSL
ncbi:MAG: radical SAM protein [Thermoplasmata archaeon]|nr:radical SAM protein [Thermoplasmata archaeon]